MKVKSIKKIESSSKRYDIGTGDNHNFFANGILVHNSSIYSDGYHARSIGLPNHPSQTLMKAKWGEVRHLIPENMRISGEYMYAKHSIQYHSLPDWFLVFGIIQDDTVLSRDEMVEWCELLGLTPIDEIWRGTWDEEKIKELFEQTIAQGWKGEEAEGIVIWNLNRFPFDEFSENVTKAVRAKHVKANGIHWRTGPVIPNKLRVAL